MSFLQDLRHGLRRLARSPGFTAIAVLVLALGIGANTVIFSFLNAVLLRPPAEVREPDRLVWIYTSDFSGPRHSASSFPDFEAFREQTGVLEGAAAFTIQPASMTIGEATSRTTAELVSADYFDVLGVTPARGRAFRPDEGATPAPVAVISHGLWQRRFGGDPGVIGSSMRLNAGVFTIVGVAPAGFRGSLRGLDIDVWLPLRSWELAAGPNEMMTERGDRGLLIIGRLRDGVTVERARSRFDAVARQLHAAYPDQWTDVNDRGRAITIVPEREARVPPQVRGVAGGFIGLLFGVVGLVLLICCANVAGLLLARALARAREIAVRRSLGASRARLVRQLLVESFVLALLSGAAGLLLATWAADAIGAASLPLPINLSLDLSLDGRVLAFTLLATVVTTLLFGLAPALRATRADIQSVLRDAGGDRAHGRLTLRNALVVAQVAITVVLLVGAGLFLRSLRSAADVNPGFDPEGVVLADFDLEAQGYDTARQRAFYDALAARVQSLPGVRDVTFATKVPLTLARSRRGTRVEGYEPRTGEDMEFHFNVVAPGYFETMRVPVPRGRSFVPGDREGAPLVAVVNESFARRFWPGAEPIGRRISWSGGATWMEVVGVARDGKYLTLADDGVPFVYTSAAQRNDPLVLHARVSGDVPRAIQLIRSEIRALDPELPILTLAPMESEIAVTLLPQRIAAGVLGLFSVLALLLAGVGLYGVLAYVVSRRTREIGIRLALGAAPGSVVGLVVKQGMRIAGVGLLLGFVLAALAGRVIAGFLFGSSAFDVPTFLGVAAVLSAAALLASWVPARRAAAVDPARAIRYE